jgi:ATP-dependent 26S proteasome regulatory subunit
VEPEELAGAIKRLTDWAEEHAPAPEPAVRRRLRDHLGADPRELPDLATALQPAMVVLEDVDLVAMDRDFEPTNAILFELLNGMDGLEEDHDVLFVLTTNRADLLEPALASRPGRIDQAVELPLPDAAGRRRLIELYGEGLELEPVDDALIEELDGVSPAFIRELLRRAALVAAEGSEGALRVTPGHLQEALLELREGAGTLTNTLVGAPSPIPAGSERQGQPEL